MQPETGIHLQRTMVSKVITDRFSWREYSRGCSSLQRTEGLFPHPCNPLNTESKAQHHKGYCLLPLTSFPFVAFTDLEMFITSTAAAVVCFNWKTKKKVIVNGHIFICPYFHYLFKKRKTVTFVPVNGNVRMKAKSFPTALKVPSHKRYLILFKT